DVITTVVNVWAEVGRCCLSPGELSQFLQLFKAKNPPLETLLRAACRVQEGSGHEPQYALAYPCTEALTQEISQSSSSLTESMASFVNVSVPSSPVVEAFTRLHDSHTRAGLISCCGVSCIVCPVPRTLDWSPYTWGLASTTWIAIRDR
ncbi:unnamed protein product, partial [Meganyctiphanes norvegica]